MSDAANLEALLERAKDALDTALDEDTADAPVDDTATPPWAAPEVMTADGELSASETAGGRVALARLALRSDSAWPDLDLIRSLAVAVYRDVPPDHPDWARWLVATCGDVAVALRRALPISDDRHSYLWRLRNDHPDHDGRAIAGLTLDIDDLCETAASGETVDRAEAVTIADSIEKLIRDRVGHHPNVAEHLLAGIDDLRSLLEEDAARLQPGHAAPDFEIELIDGRRVDLAHYRGAPLLLHFTGTWCGPCAELTPELVRQHDRWAGKARFLGIALEDEADDVRAYRESHLVTWDFALSDFDAPISQTYRVQGVPQVVLISPNGDVWESRPGRLGPDQLGTTLERFIGVGAGVSG